MGGVANFSINRYWSFCATGENIYWQVLTYLSDCLIPALVNATGVLALVEHAAIGCDRDGGFIGLLPPPSSLSVLNSGIWLKSL